MLVVVDGEYIKEAVAAQLKENSLTSHLVRYKEGQLQDFKRESVVIHQVLMQQDKLMRNRFTRNYRIRIHYFPLKSSQRPKEDCDKVGNLLSEIFLILELPGLPVRGQDIEHETVDNVLHFSVDFRVRVDLQLPEIPKQMTLDSDVRYKEE